MIKAPMLAQNFVPDKHKFPLAATPKIDGIRCLKIDGKFLSRSFKPIRNKYICTTLESLDLPDGVDGELVVKNNFHLTTSGVMSVDGEPDFKYCVFDYVYSESATYIQRIEQLCLYAPTSPHIEIILPEILYSLEDLYSYKDTLPDYYEGVILRDPDSLYECKRSKNLLKVKDFFDAEATVIGFAEKMTNQNPQQLDNFGHKKRSASKQGLVGAQTLGSLVVQDDLGREFKIGSGLDDAMRKEIWSNQSKYLGSLVKYKYMAHGVKSLPRHPIFLGFRDPSDL